MRELRNQGSACRLCGGDFNEILFHHEKSEGILRDSDKIEAFRSALQDCQLEDLGYTGFKFTWSNKQAGNKVILERLDRFMASEEWLPKFPNVRVEHLVRVVSDHNPVFLSEAPARGRWGRKKKIFRVEEMWFKDESCLNIIKETWELSTCSQSSLLLRKKLKECQEALQGWEKDHFGNVSRQLNDLRKQLEDLQKSAPEKIHLHHEIEAKFGELLRKEEVMWKQRSRVSWLLDGDKNTSFFHRTATGQKQRNFIRKICKEDGTEISDAKDIKAVFRSYFRELFTAKEDKDMGDALDAVEPVISSEMNTMLTKPFTKEEIETTLS